MNPDEQHVALPKLYGAPAYARPPRIFDTIDRPTDPDDLPLEAFRDEGFDLSSSSPLTADAGSGGAELSLASDDPRMTRATSARDDAAGPALRPRPFTVRGLARFLHRD